MRREIKNDQWSEYKEKLIRMYPMLTKSDLIKRDGTVTDMLEIISSRLGISAKELQDNIDKL
ncbi:MAG: hypothetical protein RBR30_05320 [Tenuifilaceae bacterium]|nr:hypothetical protein [Tenuifilaceae bacterium]